MKKTARIIFLIVALLMVCTTVLVACNQSKVTISASTASVKVGRITTLTATASDGSAITWSSSDTSVATVEGGKVTGVKEGTATITATSASGASATCTVTVLPFGATYTDDGKAYTNNSYMNNTPSNWNEMDYQNNDDTVIINNTTSSFFGYDYALLDESQGRVKADGTLNIENIDFEHHIVTYEAATKLEDVTSVYADAWGLTAEQKAAGGYAWRITLRDDLAWDDGTAIYAGDFVYSMQEQLNYLLQPFRANNFWSANGMKIHNAKDYYYQGRTVDLPVDGAEMSQLTKGADGKYTMDGQSVTLALRTGIASLDGDSLGDYVDYYKDKYFDMSTWATLTAVMDDEGKVPVTDDTLAAVAVLMAPLFGPCTSEDALLFLFKAQTFAPMTFDKVGIFAEDDFSLVVVLDKPESWLREDGSLSYTISNASLPLVKRDLYESLKKAPVQGSDKWTTTYNTSVETSASWGPYKLTFFQVDKQFTLERNIYWYGYGMDSKKDQYLTDKYVVEVIQEDNAIQMAFWKGEIDDITFDKLGNFAAEYQNSDYAMFTPDSSATAYGIQLYSNLSVLKNSGKNNGILAIRDFRWALSLAFDRNTFNQDQLIGTQLGLGLLGPGYYYDPENSLSYRGSDAAKAALLRTYGFTQNEAGRWTDGKVVYSDIDDATDAMTGYNLTLAKEKLALAITELTTNAEKYGYDSTKDIVLRIGKFNAKAERRAELIQNCVDALVEGSILQGKIKIEVLEINAQKSADDFRDGKFEIYCVAGIGGAVFYPFTSMDSYLGFGDLSYHGYMDTNVKLTMKMPAGDYAGAGQTLELTTKDWFYSLNGRTDEKCSYDWSAGKCPVEVRLEILAMLEEYALSQHHTIQVANSYDAYLQSAKSHNITATYNTFMGLGGAQYTRYDYTDSEWAAFLAQHNNDLSEFYKTSSAN